MKRGITLVEVLIIITIIVILGLLIYPTIKKVIEKVDDQDKKHTDTIVMVQRSQWKEVKSVLQLVCLDGHSHYFAQRFVGGTNRLAGMVLTPKLDKEGKPVACGLELE